MIDFSLGLCRAAHGDRRAQERRVKSLADLDGKTVGTVRGTTHDTQLTKEGPKGMKLVRYEDDATEAQAFLSGQVDIFSTAELLVAPIDKKNPARQVEVKFVLDTFKLAVGVKKDETRLLEEVNKWIAANLKNGKLDAIYKKYSRQRPARRHPEAVGPIMKTSMSLLRLIAGAALALSLRLVPAHADTLDDIKKAGKIRIAIDLAIPPFGMTDDKMQPTGSDVDTRPAAGQGSRRAARDRDHHGPPRASRCCRPTRPTSSSRRCRSRPTAPR